MMQLKSLDMYEDIPLCIPLRDNNPIFSDNDDIWIYMILVSGKETLDNTCGAIKNRQSRETGNIGYTKHKKKTKTNTTQYVLDTMMRKQKYR